MIPNFKPIKNVLFDSLGVHAYKTQFVGVEDTESDRVEDKLMLSLSNINKRFLRQSGISLICNLKIEGKHKILSFESSLIMFNNFPTPMVLSATPTIT